MYCRVPDAWATSAMAARLLIFVCGIAQEPTVVFELSVAIEEFDR